MWVRTSRGVVWIKAEQTKQGLWIPKRTKTEKR